MAQTVIHIIQRDKFTSGYINFMLSSFSKLKHIFFTQESGFNIDCFDNADVRYFSNNYSFCKKQRKLIESSDKIIISGLFFKLENQMLQFSKIVWNKIYLQFWGGDFYQYNENILKSADFEINKELLLTCVTNCAGVINLVEGDYSELKRILSLKDDIKHFVAEMPSNPAKKIDYTKYHKAVLKPYRIFVGNSATYENRHLEAFEYLSKYKNEDIQIVCPLSYGEDDYRKQVITEGKRIFGNKFLPITSFYDYFDYIDLLSTATVGIYNNNRQQALGNIILMMGLKKKIFLQASTPMWQYFTENGASCNNILDIEKTAFEDFVSISEEDSIKNYKTALKINNQDYISSHWQLVFDDVTETTGNDLFNKWHDIINKDIKLIRIKQLYREAKKIIKNLLPYAITNNLINK